MSESTQVNESHRVDDRLDDAQKIVQRNVYWAMGGGVLPLPLVDIVAITAVQHKMLRELSELYKVPFREGAAKKAITSLLVGIGGVGLGGFIGASLAKFVPVVGTSLGLVAIPTLSGALTHAVGQTFIIHFESGGTLFDFNAKAMRKHFESEFGRAKEREPHQESAPAAG